MIICFGNTKKAREMKVEAVVFILTALIVSLSKK